MCSGRYRLSDVLPRVRRRRLALFFVSRAPFAWNSARRRRQSRQRRLRTFRHQNRYTSRPPLIKRIPPAAAAAAAAGAPPPDGRQKRGDFSDMPQFSQSRRSMDRSSLRSQHTSWPSGASALCSVRVFFGHFHASQRHCGGRPHEH